MTSYDTVDLETPDGRDTTYMTSQTYELANYDRVLRFTGERIAHATNRRGADEDQIRWTEVDIYRTAGGHYVLHKVGKSRVYHAGPRMCSGTMGKKTTSKQVSLWAPERVVDLAPCPVCKPGSYADHHIVVVEQDRGVTFTSKSAAGVVESAHNQDSDGVTYLTKVAERALAEASEVDDQIRDAYRVETIA